MARNAGRTRGTSGVVSAGLIKAARWLRSNASRRSAAETASSTCAETFVARPCSRRA